MVENTPVFTKKLKTIISTFNVLPYLPSQLFAYKKTKFVIWEMRKNYKGRGVAQSWNTILVSQHLGSNPQSDVSDSLVF